MFIKNLLLDNHSSPYKIVISKESRGLDRLRSCMTPKYWYRFTVRFAGKTIFSAGYIKNQQECEDRAREWFKENT